MVYGSYYVQPFIAVTILAMTGRSNSRFFLTVVLALAVTTVISALLPALGPFYDPALPRTLAEQQLIDVRSGVKELRYTGIIAFPSFHTEMAILFTLVYRDIRWVFGVAMAWNAAMLMTIPYSGDHYLVDMIAGVMVAFGCYWVVATSQAHALRRSGLGRATGRIRRRIAGSRD